MESGRSYSISGREVVVQEEDDGWLVRAGGKQARHRYLDRALAAALGVSSLTATELAAAILQRPEGGRLG
ncbi:MAG TPA: hypothetical protein VLN26_04770 [Gaiellaceae bacterium]|nr:hypothetical protein [Gaiellaceae bacterium]